MRWNNGSRSKNVAVRRRIWPAAIAIGGGIGAVVLAFVAAFRGGEPRPMVALQEKSPQTTAQLANPPANLGPDSLKDFASAILGDTEDVWRDQFTKMKREYKPPRLVLFTGQVQSACGRAETEMGPLYCIEDEKIYLDLGFFQEMKDRYHAPGDFARAYVIAHEVGHHVQNLLGISKEVRTRQQGLGDKEGRELSVRLELQADFLAGAWRTTPRRLVKFSSPATSMRRSRRWPSWETNAPRSIPRARWPAAHSRAAGTVGMGLRNNASDGSLAVWRRAIWLKAIPSRPRSCRGSSVASIDSPKTMRRRT